MTDALLQENHRIYKEWEIPEEWDIEGVSMEGLNVKKVGVLLFICGRRGRQVPTSHMVVQARSKNIMGPWENVSFQSASSYGIP